MLAAKRQSRKRADKMAKELTAESLADIVSKKGLAEAQRTVEEQSGALRTQRDKLKEELSEAEKRLSIYETLLISAVKVAAKTAGIQLSLPAVRAPRGTGGGKATPEQVESVFGALGKVPLTLGGVCKAGEFQDSEMVSAALRKLVADKRVKAEGERRGKRYSAA